jgi:hypothetical protein
VYGAENSKKSNGNTRTRTTARSSTKNKKVPTIEEGKGRKGGGYFYNVLLTNLGSPFYIPIAT